MKRLLAMANRVWFPELPASRLAFLRIAIGGYALVYLADRVGSLRAAARSAPEFFAPVGPISLLSEPLAPAVLDALLGATLVANVLFVLGLLHRYSGPLFALLLLAVLSYRNSWSMIYHSENLVVLHVAILGLAPAAAAISLDALAVRLAPASRFWRHGTWLAPGGVAHGVFGWPVRLMCAVTCLCYFLAGVAKVMGPLGWSWATGEALRGQIAVDALRKVLLAGGASPWHGEFQERLGLLTAAAVGTLVLELGAPLVIGTWRPAALWAVATFGMHWGIFFAMGITFDYQLCGIAFLPFFACGGLLFARRRAPDRTTGGPYGAQGTLRSVPVES